MATSETWTPSRRLQSAAVAERQRAERELARLDDRHAQLTEALAGVAAQREELRAQLAVLNRLVHGGAEDVEASSSGEDAGYVLQGERAEIDQNVVLLRGVAIREAAVRVLAASSHIYEAMHYRDWYKLLIAEGLRPAGKEPLATFLTQLGRAPGVQRADDPGVYRLNHDYPQQARARLDQLRTELRCAHETPVKSDVDALSAAREHRAALVVEVERLERDLEEALRSLRNGNGNGHLDIVD